MPSPKKLTDNDRVLIFTDHFHLIDELFVRVCEFVFLNRYKVYVNNLDNFCR